MVDYSAPKKYEIAGITSSGTANFDQRQLHFAIGDVVEIPGEKITKSIKRLWDTGMYEDINISVTRVMDNKAFIDVYLVERSRLVAFSFIGTSKSDENEIREKIKISQGHIVNDNLKTTCANIIKQYYIDKGFYNCTVEVVEEKNTKVVNGVNLQFIVKKGKKVKIGFIQISGNNHVSKAPLVKAMKGTREKSRFMPFYKADTVILHMFKNPKYYASKDLLEHLSDYFSERVKFRLFKSSKFNADSYEEDKIALIEKYNEFGFRDAFIEHDTVMIDKNVMNIHIKVNEGKKYYFRNISFVGNTKYRSELLHQLLNIEKGEVYNLSRLNQNLTMNAVGTDISSLYMNDGYLFFYANPVEIGRAHV
jgi:outer membrane protein insertion porin family